MKRKEEKGKENKIIKIQEFGISTHFPTSIALFELF